jgi:hypothetical protein
MLDNAATHFLAKDDPELPSGNCCSETPMTGGNEGASSAPDAWGPLSLGVICRSFSKNFRPVTTFLIWFAL